MLLLKTLITLLVVAALLFTKTLLKLFITRKQVARELSQLRPEKINDPGSVKSLTVLPLVDFFAGENGLKTEAGVSYHITAGGTRLLLDVGANGKKEHPSPLIHNMEKLGQRLEDLDFIFFSHSHLDHVGGLREQKTGEFSLSAGKTDLPEIPVYSPVPLKPSAYNPGPLVRVITDPFVISEGIVSIGAIPRALYLMGYTLENSLAFRLEGKGVVLVIGCGHQTIERIIERAKALFDDPIHAIIGGLHLPAGGGRIKIGPVDIQPIVGTDRVPWKKMDRTDTLGAIDAVKAANPALIALSPHDSSDETLELFRKEFGGRFRVIRVGEPIVL
jgi:7,8-dihydropterin-6-yl-methyl-4-(beta-D-ribofuranosyl)aminobenzene 5'-phosphate synthase